MLQNLGVSLCQARWRKAVFHTATLVYGPRVSLGECDQFIPPSENGSDCIPAINGNRAQLQTGLLCTKAWPTTCDISERVVSTKPSFKLLNYSSLRTVPDGWMLVTQQHLSGYYLNIPKKRILIGISLCSWAD